MGWGGYNQRCNQPTNRPNKQLPDDRASPDFLLDLLDFKNLEIGKNPAYGRNLSTNVDSRTNTILKRLHDLSEEKRKEKNVERFCDFSPPPTKKKINNKINKKKLLGGGWAKLVDQWEASNWSCDLRTNERPKKNYIGRVQTDIFIDGHRKSMKESA